VFWRSGTEVREALEGSLKWSMANVVCGRQKRTGEEVERYD
jgi:hypothetical protein